MEDFKITTNMTKKELIEKYSKLFNTYCGGHRIKIETNSIGEDNGVFCRLQGGELVDIGRQSPPLHYFRSGSTYRGNQKRQSK